MNGTATGPRRDYYEVLGVARDADDKTIREAFRRLARRYHPDVSTEPGAEGRFKEIAEAYGVLSDPAKRASYDARGFAGVASGQEYTWGDIDFGDILSGLGFGEDLLTRLFRGPRYAGPPRGEDIQIPVTVPMPLVLKGGEQTVTIPARKTCPQCSGTGAGPGTSPRTCPDCGGTGRRISTTRQLGVLIRQTTACPSCRGLGTVIDHPCAVCRGSGQVPGEDEITVKIPKGIPDGTLLRLPGHGLPAPPPGGQPGDAFLVVIAEPVPGFTRSGADLLHDMHVTVADAALGTTVRLAAPAGPVKVSVPAGTQPGTVLRLRGHGLPRYGGHGRGDLNVNLLVDIPRRLSRQQRRLYEQLRAGEAREEADDHEAA
jgi:molecular chaperone DnaJ